VEVIKMDKKTFNLFMQDMCKLLKGKGMSITDVSEMIEVNKSSLYGYIGNIEKQWCPERKHDNIIEKFKSLSDGDEEMVYVLDKYNMVQKVTFENDKNNKKSQDKDFPPVDLPFKLDKELPLGYHLPFKLDNNNVIDAANNLGKDLKNMHESIKSKIETLEIELQNLKADEKIINDTIQSLNSLKDIKI
jgi:hypothetical protein